MTPLLKSACCAICLLVVHTLGAQDSGLVPDVSAKQEYWARFDHKDWAAAVEAAQVLVAAARKEHAAPVELAEALELLGGAQLRNADLAGAEASFKEALALVEAAEGRASGLTLEPLRGLGFTLAARNRHAEAVPYLDRALLISHRTHGLFDESQGPILKQLASSLTYSGQALVAERHVKFLLQVGERAYGQDDPRLVPLMCEVGDWQAEVGNFDKARRQYRDAIRLVEEKFGKEHPAIVLPLRRLASSYPKQYIFFAKGFLDPEMARSESASHELPYKRNPRHIDSEGQRALLRALDVLNAQPDPSQTLLAETLVDVGDWFQFKQDAQKALPYYRQAAQILAAMRSAAPDTTPDPLAFPALIYYPVPHAIARGNRLAPDQREEAFVQMEFDVSSDGTVQNAVVTDSNTYPRHISEILDAIKDARFRPEFADGEPVATTRLQLRETYPVKRLPKSETSETEDPS